MHYTAKLTVWWSSATDACTSNRILFRSGTSGRMALGSSICTPSSSMPMSTYAQKKHVGTMVGPITAPHNSAQRACKAVQEARRRTQVTLLVWLTTTHAGRCHWHAQRSVRSADLATAPWAKSSARA